MNLNQITIHVTDVLRSMAFYQKLGLRLIVDASPRYVRFECPAGDSTFSISHSEQQNNQVGKPVSDQISDQMSGQMSGLMGDGSHVIYFEVADVDRVYQQLKQAGIQNLTAPKDQRWLWREVNLADPDGYPLKIYSAGNNRKNPPWRVKAPRWYDVLLESPLNLMK